MIVLIAGAHGRLGSRLVALLSHRGHAVRALVRTDGQAEALRAAGVEALVADLRGDVEWTAQGCDATVFAAAARARAELGAVDAAGAAKLAAAAYRYEHQRFVLCSVIGAARHEQRRDGPVGEFLAAKHHAEHRVAQLDMPWTILRFGRLTEHPGTGRIHARIAPGAPLRLRRDDAALAVGDALERRHLAGLAVPIIDGDRHVADALDAVEPLPLPPAAALPTGAEASLGQAQADNPPDAPDMIAPDAHPMDADVEWEGDGPVALEPVGNEDPAPGMP